MAVSDFRIDTPIVQGPGHHSQRDVSRGDTIAWTTREVIALPRREYSNEQPHQDNPADNSTTRHRHLRCVREKFSRAKAIPITRVSKTTGWSIGGVSYRSSQRSRTLVSRAVSRFCSLELSRPVNGAVNAPISAMTLVPSCCASAVRTDGGPLASGSYCPRVQNNSGRDFANQLPFRCPDT